MIIQTNPEIFSRTLPVHTVTHIDRSKGIVTLSGSDSSSLEVPRSFAFFAKGGSRGCWRKFVDHVAVYHKSSGTGSIASHPCKVRKDGAPSVVVMPKRSQAWATRPTLTLPDYGRIARHL